MVARTQSTTRAKLPATQRVTGSPFDPFVRAVFPKIAERTPRFITPNMVTIAGFAATVTAGVLLVLSRFAPWLLFVVALLVVVNWFTDTLDGVLARQRDECTRLGDYLDHVFDAATCAVLIVGTAFSGLGHAELPLLLGVVFLLSFAFTYKGEHVTGVYELLTLGPTEVRLVLVGVYVTSFFVTQPLLTVGGVELRFMDFAAAGSTAWAFFYAVILAIKYGRLVKRAER